MWANFWSQYGPTIIEVYSIVITILVVVVTFLIFMERRNPYKTIAWLVVLNVFPLIGMVLYLTFGQKLRKRKKIKTKYINEMNQLESIVDHQIEYINTENVFESQKWGHKKQLVKLLLRNANAPFTGYNQAKVLSDGQEAFQDIFTELEKAKEHIHIEYYIIRDDNTGQKLKGILLRKAQAGVKVRIIYDAVGSWKLSNAYIKELKSVGIEIFPFLPVVFPFINNRLNYRNHRKIIVIDGHVGFLGGLNIGDEYLGQHPKLGHWRDTHLQITGPSVYFLQVIFLLDWEFVSGDKIKDDVYFPRLKSKGDKIIQIAASGPDSYWEAILQSYFALINSAQKSIKITTPYLIPDEGILLALKTAALSGIDIKIILPGIPDKKIVYWASQSYFDELLEAGIEIYLYQPGFIHAKIISVDGEVASLGSANMDMRSFQLNFEVNALLYDQEVVTKLDNDFANDLANSIKVDLAEFAQRPLTVKIRQSAARLLSPIL